MDATGITAVFLKSIFSGIKKRDCVGFGRYCQENSSEKTPIEWLMLQTTGTTVLLISRCALDCKPYQAYYKEDMTWENCDLRGWLNGEFLRNAFTGEEQKMIALSKLANDDNPEYGTSGGNTTEDRVFCLSLAEAETLFESRDARKCIPTPYAVKQGADKYGISEKSNCQIDGRACCWWWLRSPGMSEYDASCVGSDGYIDSCGDFKCYDDMAVRPALRVNVSGENC